VWVMGWGGMVCGGRCGDGRGVEGGIWNVVDVLRFT